VHVDFSVLNGVLLSLRGIVNSTLNQ
jgi:hypothetical protein